MADISNVKASYEFESELTDTIGSGDAWTASGSGSYETGPAGWGTVYRQDASSDALTISSEPSWWSDWISNDSCTIELLVRANADAGDFDTYFLSQVVSGSPFRLLELWFRRFGGGWFQSLNNGSGTDPNVADTITGAESFHIFAIFDGRDQTLYVHNGTTGSSSSETADADPATANAFSSMTFGAANWNSIDVGLIRFWDTALDSTDIANQVADPFGVTSGGGSLTAPFIESASTLYAPTVSSGPLSITAPLITSTSQTYGPTVSSLSPLSVTTPLIGSTAQLFATTVSSSGALNITAPFIASSSSIYAATVAISTAGITAPLIASTSTVYPPTISAEALSVVAPIIGSTSNVFGPAVSASSLSLTAPLIASTEELFAPTVDLENGSLVAPLIASTASIFAPTVSVVSISTVVAVSLDMSECSASLDMSEVDASLDLSEIAVSLQMEVTSTGAILSQTVAAPLISSASQLYAPTLALGSAGVTAPIIASTSEVYAPTLALGSAGVTAPIIASTSEVYAPTVALGASDLVVPLIASASQLYSPTVDFGSEQSLTAPAVSSSSAIYAPTVSLGSASEVTAPIITAASQLYAPTVSDGSEAQELTAPLIGSTAQLFAPVLWRTEGAPADAAAAVTAAQSDIGDFTGFTATLPTFPSTTGSATCATSTEVNSALASDAMHITITGDMTGVSFSIPSGRTDIWIDGDSPNIGTWTVNLSCKRIHFDGVRMNGVQMVGYNSTTSNVVTDVAITDCLGVGGGQSGGGTFLNLRGWRILVSGCETLDEIDDYAIYCDNGLGTADHQCRDVVIVNNRFEVGDAQACTRFYHTNRLVMTGNLLSSRSRHCFRLHSESTTYITENVYFSHNQLENHGFMFCSQGSTERVSNAICQYNTQTMRQTDGSGSENSMTQFYQFVDRLYDFSFINNWCATDYQDQNPGNDSFATSNPNPGGWTWSGNTVVYASTGATRSTT